MNNDSMAVPNFLLLTYRKLPLILMVLLSVPDSIRARLSFKSVDSVNLSDLDMKGFIEILLDGLFESFCLLARIACTSCTRDSLAIMGLDRSSEYLPKRVQSQTEWSERSGHMECTISLTAFVSSHRRLCMRVPLGHSLMPYTTMLNLCSEVKVVALGLCWGLGG